MKTKLKTSIVNFAPRRSRLAALIITFLLGLAFLSGQETFAGQTLTWTNYPSTVWTNYLNWSPNQVPGSADTAYFNGDTNTVVAISAKFTSGVQPLGAYVMGPNQSTLILEPSVNNYSIARLQLNGVGGILLSNGSTSVMDINAYQGSVTAEELAIALNGSGAFYANTTALPGSPPNNSGEINLFASIYETNGSQSITLTGPGLVYFQTNNFYTGTTTISNGTARMLSYGTFGAGTVYLSGGNIQCDTSRNGTSAGQLPITNNIVLTTNAYIYNVAGTANTTRYFALSGAIGGNNGTLVICNPTGISPETFDVRLLGAFTFNQPIIVGNQSDPFGNSGFDDNSSSFSQIEFDNLPGTGTQTFNGNISGVGSVIRGSATSATGGATFLTGNNTYSGGTLISSGTLFADNSTGSALGSGVVTVTNQGTLAGDGSVSGAAVSIYYGGAIQPGPTNNSVGKLAVGSGLTFYSGSSYSWEITNSAGTPGAGWDLVDASGGGWTDAGSTTNPITININSGGVVPAGWNDASSYSWMIITNNGGGTSFNVSDWAVTTTGFLGQIAGVFGVTTDANGDLLLTYTPSAGNIVINVASGTVNQGGVTPTNYPVITGLYSVTKVGNGEVVMTNSLNSYQGQTTIDAGTASAAVNSTTGGGAFGASTAPILLGNTTGNSNATLNIDQPGVSIANAVTVQAGSSGVLTIGTTITSGQAGYSGNVTLNTNVTINAATGSLDLISGNFSGSGGITFAGGGTNTISGSGAYGGPTTLTGGALNINASSIGTNIFTISAPSALDNTSGSSVTLANNPPLVWNSSFGFTGSASLNLGTGPVTLNTNCTLTVSSNLLTVGGSIAGTGFGLTLVGPGGLYLAGATNSTYTGGTTNLGGLLAISATATFGSGAGPLVFNGAAGVTNYLLDTGSRAGLPIGNPVQINTPLRVYGNSTTVSSPTRVLPFTNTFTFGSGGQLIIDDIGSATTIFNLRLFATNGNSSYANVNWPVIIIGDPTFDTANTTNQLDLENDNTTPPMILSSTVSGTGQILRSGLYVNSGGTTIMTAQNTFSGGFNLYSGAVGLGASSILSGGSIVSGPLGTGTFQLGNQTAETALTVFATVGPTLEIDNPIYFDGDTNMVFAGTNNMLFTGNLNAGGVAKTITVTNGLVVTFSGTITNTAATTGGALTKAGGGKLVFSGTNGYAGTTTINAGTLLVSGALSTNTVTANSGGTFGGTGSLGGNLVFNTGSQAYLFKTAGSPDSPLTVAGNLTLNGNTVTVDLGGTTTLSTGTYTLLNYSGTLSGTASATPVLVNGSLSGGHVATIDLSTPNEVNLIVTAGSVTSPGFPPGALSKLPSGNVSLVSTGALGGTYRLWATTNLAATPVTNTWTLLSSGTVTTSPFTNFDLTATNYPQRFYLFTTP